MSPESTPATAREELSLVSLVYGAVVGIFVGMLLKPVLRFLPGDFFEEFLTEAVQTACTVGLALVFAYLAGRIHRLDLFLKSHLSGMSSLAAIILAGGLWGRAGHPVQLNAVLCLIATFIVTWFFLELCGGAVLAGLGQITGAQKAEALRRREAEAQDIAMEAIAAGEPERAVAEFGLNAAGGVMAGLSVAMLMLVVTTVSLLSVLGVTLLDAYVLFKLTAAWSGVMGVLVVLTAAGLIGQSAEFGERRSETVPLDSKYKGIRHD